VDQTTLRIEPMRAEDLQAVLAIEHASFSLPWTAEMFTGDLERDDLAEILVARCAEAGDPAPVAGFLCYWIVQDEMHINNLAVDPRWRRRGIAAALLTVSLTRARARGARQAFLEVRASNLAAQALYRQAGFAAAGTRRRYYSKPVEDAVIMRRTGL
jgi:[ribosomal protein S18]-alanine N-acetyltransferase